MLDATTKRRIDDARDILVGKIPDPKSQVEQITIALIYKFMDDMDTESEELGGTAKFFVGDYKKYSWRKVFNKTRGGQEILLDYREALQQMSENPSLPSIFHTIFRQAYLPYNDPETLKEFLKIIDQFDYDHSEKLGDAFEYLLSVLGSQGDAGQFRTPRHIIDFMVDIVEPKKNETILDPACGTAGFLISSYKHILKSNSSEGKSNGDLLTPDERRRLSENISGYDISPDMVRLSLVNMYLHRITEPKIVEYDTLTSDTKWNEYFDVVLANPPFMSPKGGIKPHSRFSVQSKRSEALFVDYIAEHLTTTGRGAVIVPEGVIFKSDTAFTKLRKMLVEDNYLYGVISLPSGVFNPYSGVKTSILLFDKVISKLTDKILFAKVENDGFSLGAQRRPIEGSQLDAITSTIKKFRIQLHRGEEFTSDVCTLVDKAKIAESGDYNLGAEKYLTSKQAVPNHYVKVGDVCTILSGYPFDSKLFSESNGFPVIRIRDIKPNATKTLYEGDVIESHVVEDGDLLIGMDGEFNTTLWNGGRALLNQRVCKLYSFKGALKEYVYYLIKKPLKEIEDSTYAVTVKHISNKQILGIEIPLPSIEEQRAIVAEIEGYQKIIDAARTIVDNYRPQITINPDWKMVELGAVTSFSQGVQVDLALQSKEHIKDYDRFIRIENYTQKSDDFRYIPQKLSKGKYIELDDVVVVRYGATAGFIGRGFKGVLANNLFKVAPNTDILTKSYLYQVLSSNQVQNEFKRISAGGAMPALSFKAVEVIKIPLPDIEIQQQIVAEIEKEQAAVDSAKELIEIFTKKITNRIAQIWNE